MKIIPILILLLVSLNINAQLNFSKSDVIKGCFSPVIPPHEEPFFISSEKGFHIIKEGKKQITQVDLDKNLKFIEKKKFDFQKEYRLKEIFSIDNKVFFVGRDERFRFVFMEHNPETGVPQKKCIVNVENKERLSLVSMDRIDFSGEGVAFKLVFGKKRPITKILMMNKDLSVHHWTKVLNKPKTPKHEYPRNERIEIRDTNTIVVNYNHYSYDRKLLFASTSMYIVEDNVMDLVWLKKTKKEKIVNVLESDPMPIIDSDAIEYYILHWDLKEKNIYLTLHDESGDEKSRISVADKVEPVAGVLKMSIEADVELFTDDSNGVRFNFTVEQQSQREFLIKNLSFDLKDKKVKNYQFGGYRFPFELDEILISEYDLAFMDGEKIVTSNPKEVFDRYGRTSSFIKNYFIDDHIYSLFSIYLTGNMTTQIVRWQFN